MCDCLPFKTVHLGFWEIIMQSFNDSNRVYRQEMGCDRPFFVVSSKDSNLWVAYSGHNVDLKEIRAFAQDYLNDLREELELYCAYATEFRESLKPYTTDFSAPTIAQHMSRMSYRSNVGPMAGVAGGFAQYLGQELLQRFSLSEILVENGGDLFISSDKKMNVKLFAGGDPAAENITLSIPASYGPLGLCASSGKFGPSLSLGKADLVVVACRDAILADQFATAYANRIRSKSDVAVQIEDSRAYPEILSLVIVMEKTLAIRGELSLSSL